MSARGTILLAVAVLLLVSGHAEPAFCQKSTASWKRWVIDNSSRGADGVRLGDLNSDGLPDIVTGWEEGGITRVYLHPGHRRAKDFWPAVTVGKTPSVEDAVFADLDCDGRLDVVTCCEGETKCMFFHFAPSESEKLLDEHSWQSYRLPASEGIRWMFCTPVQLDAKGPPELIAAGKQQNAQLGIWHAEKPERDPRKWHFLPLRPVGWVMSIRTIDVDGDNDADIVFSDRQGPKRGVYWLENPGCFGEQTIWHEHPIGGIGREVMFLDLGDLNGDGAADIACAARPQSVLIFLRRGRNWLSAATLLLPDSAGTAKAAAIGDINLDGRIDLVATCEQARGQKRGVWWFENTGSEPANWPALPISNSEGIKFDRLELIDLDGDGDLDVLTCEESAPEAGYRKGLGVIWYENPTR